VDRLNLPTYRGVPVDLLNQAECGVWGDDVLGDERIVELRVREASKRTGDQQPELHFATRQRGCIHSRSRFVHSSVSDSQSISATSVEIA
jgi:hypothetical protein